MYINICYLFFRPRSMFHVTLCLLCVPLCRLVFLRVPWCPPVSPQNVSPGVPSCPLMSPHVPSCPLMSPHCWDTCLHTSQQSPACPSTCWDTCPPLSPVVPQCPPVSPDVPPCPYEKNWRCLLKGAVCSSSAVPQATGLPCSIATIIHTGHMELAQIDVFFVKLAGKTV